MLVCARPVLANIRLQVHVLYSAREASLILTANRANNLKCSNVQQASTCEEVEAVEDVVSRVFNLSSCLIHTVIGLVDIYFFINFIHVTITVRVN